MNPSLEPRNRAGRTPRRFHARYAPLSHHTLPQPVGNLPTHRSIVVVDVVSFTRPDRDNVDQLAIRDALYRTLHEAFEESGIPWRQTVREDRGDGVLIFVSAEVSKVLLLGALPARLGALLAHGNAQRAPRQRFRLRVAVHAGEVHHDAHGYAGYDVNLAFRLVDAQPLRAAMAASAAPVGLIVSEGVHDGVLRHGYGGLDPAAFQRVPVRVKTADVAGWIQLVSGGAEAATGPGADASATPGAPVPAPRQAALVVRTVESVDELVRLDPAEQNAAGVSGAASGAVSGAASGAVSGAVSDATSGPVAVLLADEASLLDELAGLGVRTVVLVGGAAGLAQTLAPIARQSIYIEHELIE
jgi:hypothetical protein